MYVLVKEIKEAPEESQEPRMSLDVLHWLALLSSKFVVSTLLSYYYYHVYDTQLLLCFCLAKYLLVCYNTTFRQAFIGCRTFQ